MKSLCPKHVSIKLINTPQRKYFQRDLKMETQRFKIADILFGLVIPIILAVLIFALAYYINPSGSEHILGATGALGTVGVILTQGFAQMIVLGVPMVLGLLWNKWAGGAAGFIMGGLYYVAAAGQYNGLYAMMGGVSVGVPVTNDTLLGIANGSITFLAGSGTSTVPYNFFGDLSMLFYLVNAVIIGYIAGGLNNGSTNFKRMIGAGLTAAMTTAVIQTIMNYYISLPPARGMAQGSWTADPVNAFVIAFVPSIALGVIVPILAKVMTWYGLQPTRHQ